MVKKKKHTPSWKIAVHSTGTIAIFFLLSTLYDLTQGDINFSRIFTLTTTIMILLTIAAYVGVHRIIVWLKKALGM